VKTLRLTVDFAHTVRMGPGYCAHERIDGKRRASPKQSPVPPDRPGPDPLMRLQLQVLEKTEFEKRLGKLERLMREGIMENRKGNAAGEIRERVEPGQTEAINTEK